MALKLVQLNMSSIYSLISAAFDCGSPSDGLRNLSGLCHKRGKRCDPLHKSGRRRNSIMLPDTTFTASDGGHVFQWSWRLATCLEASLLDVAVLRFCTDKAWRAWYGLCHQSRSWNLSSYQSRGSATCNDRLERSR